MVKIDWNIIRSQIPALNRSIYMNTGGTGPLPRSVISEISDTYRTIGEMGPDISEVSDPIEKRFEQTREIVARFLGVSSEEIAFTRSISEGLSTVAYGLDWHMGDEVIVTDEEYPSGIMIWLSIANRIGIKIKKLPLISDREELLSVLKGMISDKTRLLSLSHVTAETGTRLPAKDICLLAHEQGIPVLFDGAQAAGQFPLDLREIDCDFYVCTGYKWLLGGCWGAGMFYVKKDWIRKLNVSWTGSKAGDWDRATDAFSFDDTAHRFEFGSRSKPLYNGMGKGVEFLESIGMDNIETRVRNLNAKLKAAIKEIPGVQLQTPEPPKLSTGIVTFSITGMTGTELSNQMWERWRVKGRPAQTGRINLPTAMRLSTAFFTSNREIETIIMAIGILANEDH